MEKTTETEKKVIERILRRNISPCSSREDEERQRRILKEKYNFLMGDGEKW